MYTTLHTHDLRSLKPSDSYAYAYEYVTGCRVYLKSSQRAKCLKCAQGGELSYNMLNTILMFLMFC